MGSTRDARSAGIAHAASATVVSVTATPMNTTGSRTGTPKTKTKLDTAHQNAMKTARLEAPAGGK
jgi:hypothetical protein